MTEVVVIVLLVEVRVGVNSGGDCKDVILVGCWGPELMTVSIEGELGRSISTLTYSSSSESDS